MTTLVELCASPDTTDDAKLTALDEAKARLTEAGHGLLWREDGTVEIVGIPQNGKGDWLRKTIKCDWYEMVPCTVEARLQGYIIWVDESGAPYLDEDHLSKHFGVSAETFRVLEGLLREETQESHAKLSATMEEYGCSWLAGKLKNKNATTALKQEVIGGALYGNVLLEPHPIK